MSGIQAKLILPRGQKPFVSQTSDEFDGDRLGRQWQWHANHRDDWYSLSARPGWLRLFPQVAAHPLNEQPNLLLQKFPARNFTVETELQLFAQQWGEEAGLVVGGGKNAMLGIWHDGLQNWLVLRTDDKWKRLRSLNSHPVKLRVEVRSDGHFTFSFGIEDEFIFIPQVFEATKGGWMGAKLGLYCIKQVVNTSAGYANFDYFRFI